MIENIYDSSNNTRPIHISHSLTVMLKGRFLFMSFLVNNHFLNIKLFKQINLPRTNIFTQRVHKA